MHNQTEISKNYMTALMLIGTSTIHITYQTLHRMQYRMFKITDSKNATEKYHIKIAAYDIKN